MPGASSIEDILKTPLQFTYIEDESAVNKTIQIEISSELNNPIDTLKGYINKVRSPLIDSNFCPKILFLFLYLAIWPSTQSKETAKYIKMLEIKKSPNEAKIPERIKVKEDIKDIKLGLNLNKTNKKNKGREVTLIKINAGLSISRFLISSG